MQADCVGNCSFKRILNFVCQLVFWFCRAFPVCVWRRWIPGEDERWDCLAGLSLSRWKTLVGQVLKSWMGKVGWGFQRRRRVSRILCLQVGLVRVTPAQCARRKVSVCQTVFATKDRGYCSPTQWVSSHGVR